MMGVHESYFNNHYISQKKWLGLWQKSIRRDDVQIVDARRIKGKGKGVGDTHSSAMAGVLETAKYCTKPSDYLKIDEKTGKYSVNDKVLEVLMRNLKGRKLVALGGAFREIYKKLKMQDEESSDLIRADLDQDNKFVALYEALWRSLQNPIQRTS
jgi:plasmid rolling circle replication initiator protein Rep